ncbi:MAG: hypothetical protein FIB08_08155 [Candidatus Methanoperedens sp.]|nr:hypothetical protein [Candidatus Methanoperedens sp.]
MSPLSQEASQGKKIDDLFGVPIACKKHGLNYNNNAIERHDDDFKQRSNIMRGFKSKNSGSAFTELGRIVYNFVRTHLGLGKTPADEAGLKNPMCYGF